MPSHGAGVVPWNWLVLVTSRVATIAAELRISGWCLRRWAARDDVNHGRHEAPTTDGRRELVWLRRGLRRRRSSLNEPPRTSSLLRGRRRRCGTSEPCDAFLSSSSALPRPRPVAGRSGTRALACRRRWTSPYFAASSPLARGVRGAASQPLRIIIGTKPRQGGQPVQVRVPRDEPQCDRPPRAAGERVQ